jgi:GPH family glycoside/pentoside/hexuronide:cation symporter
MSPFWRRWLFGLGGAASNLMPNAPVIMLFPIYNIGLGLNPAVLSVIMALPRIMEIFFDPWLGTFSDRTVSKWGRRRPFIFVGATLSGLLFISMWWVPPHWGHHAQMAWLTVTMMLYFAAYSVFYVPYTAFGIEVVRGDESERLRLMGAVNAFSNFASFPMGWLYFLCCLSFFTNPVEGMRWVGLALGIIMGACAFIPALVYQEPPDFVPENMTAGETREVISIWELFRDRNFNLVLVCFFSLIFGFALVAGLGYYILRYYACQGDAQLANVINGWANTGQALLGTVAAAWVGALARKFGRHHTLIPFLAVSFIGNISMIWCLNHSMPYFYVISVILSCFSIWGFWTIIPALVGSISDDIERRTGKICQGVISAVSGVAGKIALSAALLLTGFVMVLCGFDVNMPADKMVGPLLKMRAVYAVLPALSCVIVGLAAWNIRVPTHPNAKPDVPLI